jgi:hypothetical protein
VANQTSVIFNKEINTHLVDSLLALHDRYAIYTRTWVYNKHGRKGNRRYGPNENRLISLHGKIRKPHKHN